jgi:type II secretory pathway pseudopilin PulG
MYCTNCGKKNEDRASFCFACGTPLSANMASTAAPRSAVLDQIDTARRRPVAISILAVLQFIAAALWLAAALVTIVVALGTANRDPFVALVVLFLGGLGALQLTCGIGLWRLKGFGRTIQLALSWLGLLGIPFGTIVSIVVLVYLYKPGVKLLFAEKPDDALTPDERAEVARVVNSSATVVVVLLVLAVTVIGFAGIVAAVAIPGLVRARTAANEAAAIGALRAINSAQNTYFAKCDAYAPSLPALNAREPFVSADLASASIVTRTGYRITMEPAGNATRVPAKAECDGAVSDYFARADPVTPGSSGVRYFATDARGTIWQDSSHGIGNPVTPSPTTLPIR